MSSPTQFRFIFAAIAIVAAVGAAVFVYSRRSAPASVAPQTSAAPAVSTSPVTSTVVADLGPEWRVMWQKDISEFSLIPGAQTLRETFAQLKSDTSQLHLTELKVVNSSELYTYLAGNNMRRTVVASRDGYIMPIAGLVPSSAFTLVGTSTVLLIEYGDARWGNLMEWPDTPEPQVVNAVQRLRVY